MAVNPDTGKTHTRHCRFVANGHNLSGDMQTLGGFGVTTDNLDVSSWEDEMRQSLGGRGDVAMSLTALFNETASATGPVRAGTHEALAAATSVYASIFIGIRAAPVIGNASGAALFEQGTYTVSADSGPVMVNADFRTSALLAQSSYLWGVALAVGAEVTATGQGGSVDNGALSTGGYIAFLHLTQTAAAMASNNWTFVIEHGTNDSTWADLATFTANGSTITAERKEASGTVNRYVRFKYTRTAGTARPWVTFIRK